ncbi:MAG: hypothetical protein R3E98_02640 [Gemmatimonadota bacterium]|nr:hypothetical protein [Gemmatimonadota bacterium]
MSGFLASPHLADLVLGVLILEATVLAVWARRSGRGPSVSAWLPFLIAGACFALALRVVLAGGSSVWVGAALVGAGIAHGVDLGLRLRDGSDR